MGNKDMGRAVANLNNIDYHTAMGADVHNLINTGVSFTNYEVYKYFKQLRTYALNRVKWLSDELSEYELRLIEWYIFHYGKCAMLRPKITRKNVTFTLNKLKIYQCNFSEINYRSGRAKRISIINSNANDCIIDVNYNSDEFVIFTDEYIQKQTPAPFITIAWEFACKLHELDLAFNANSHKLRMPFVFNNGASETEKDGTFNVIANKGVSIAEVMRSAFGRNEQFIEIPQSMVGLNGFVHNTGVDNNHMLEHIEAQKKLYQAYFELLGLYTDKDKQGVYKVKRLQEDGDDTGDYITNCIKSTRLMCAKEASLKFKINISLEMV